jgi:hypothetical protein
MKKRGLRFTEDSSSVKLEVFDNHLGEGRPQWHNMLRLICTSGVH